MHRAGGARHGFVRLVPCGYTVRKECMIENGYRVCNLMQVNTEAGVRSEEYGQQRVHYMLYTRTSQASKQRL